MKRSSVAGVGVGVLDWWWCLATRCRGSCVDKFAATPGVAQDPGASRGRRRGALDPRRPRGISSPAGHARAAHLTAPADPMTTPSEPSPPAPSTRSADAGDDPRQVTGLLLAWG